MTTLKQILEEGYELIETKQRSQIYAKGNHRILYDTKLNREVARYDFEHKVNVVYKKSES